MVWAWVGPGYLFLAGAHLLPERACGCWEASCAILRDQVWSRLGAALAEPARQAGPLIHHAAAACAAAEVGGDVVGRGVVLGEVGWILRLEVITLRVFLTRSVMITEPQVGGDAADRPDRKAGGAGDVAVADLGAEHLLHEVELREGEGRTWTWLHLSMVAKLQLSNCNGSTSGMTNDFFTNSGMLLAAAGWAAIITGAHLLESQMAKKKSVKKTAATRGPQAALLRPAAGGGHRARPRPGRRGSPRSPARIDEAKLDQVVIDGHAMLLRGLNQIDNFIDNANRAVREAKMAKEGF